jgi:hypothetical protein
MILWLLKIDFRMKLLLKIKPKQGLNLGVCCVKERKRKKTIEDEAIVFIKNDPLFFLFFPLFFFFFSFMFEGQY